MASGRGSPADSVLSTDSLEVGLDEAHGLLRTTGVPVPNASREPVAALESAAPLDVVDLEQRALPGNGNHGDTRLLSHRIAEERRQRDGQVSALGLEVPAAPAAQRRPMRLVVGICAADLQVPDSASPYSGAARASDVVLVSTAAQTIAAAGDPIAPPREVARRQQLQHDLEQARQRIDELGRVRGHADAEMVKLRSHVDATREYVASLEEQLREARTELRGRQLQVRASAHTLRCYAHTGSRAARRAARTRR